MPFAVKQSNCNDLAITYERPFRVKGKIGRKEYELNVDSGSSLDFSMLDSVVAGRYLNASVR